jgi:hypothetical protein
LVSAAIAALIQMGSFDLACVSINETMPFRLFFKTNTPFRSSCFSAQTSSKIHLVDCLVDGD